MGASGYPQRSFSEDPPVSILGSHAQRAPLQKFLYSADAGHPGKNHDGQTDKTDQATNVENLRYRAELSPFGHHGYTSFPEYLEFVSARFAFFVVNLDYADSQ
jgi:hypothetical protein